MTFLLTDILFFGMLIAICFAIYGLKNSPSLMVWQKIFNAPTAMSSFIILIYFIIIATIDSIHWYDSAGKISSLLDYLLNHLNQRVEKTYTAPFEVYFNQEINWLKPIGLTIVFSFIINSLFIYTMTKLKINYLKTISGKSFLITNFVCLLIVFSLYDLSQVTHVFGTDKVGQDVLLQSIKSIRTGLIIGSLTTIITLPLGIALGLSAGYYGGLIDDIIQYIYTVLNSIPGVLLIAGFFLILSAQTNHVENNLLKADFKLLGLCFILGMTSWTGLCRLLRAETLKIRELAYVKASKILGTPSFKIILRHILPNTMHLILITLVMDFSGLVLAEAVLSYIGIGVDPSMNSWGNMINSSRLEFSREPIVWWSLASVFVMMLPLVLATNLFAEVVREKFDLQ